MTDPNELPPESEDDALEEVESLGGDDAIMESLPPEGSPISTDTAYDEIDGSGVLDDGDAHDYSADAPVPLDALTYSEDEASADEADAYSYDAEGTYWPEGTYASGVGDDLSDLYTQDTRANSDDAYDFLDIEAALASVSTLGEAAAEREQAEIAEQVAIEAAVEAQEEKRRPLRRVAGPPMLTMRRGHVASVVPALVLILLGGWLTFAVTAPNAVPISPLLVALAGGVAVVLTLLAFWIASARWSRGVLFFALLALLTSAALYYETTLNLTFSITGPLVLTAAGLSFALTALLARPTDGRLLLPAILLLAAAAVNVAVTIGYLPVGLMTAAATYWPVLVVFLIVVWLLPVVVRRRS